MPLENLQRLDNKIKNYTRLYYVIGVIADILFSTALVFLWNWLFSDSLNLFLFGTEKLSVLKGVITLITLQLVLIKYKSILTSTKQNNNGE